MVYLFYEPSTRTNLSFQTATQRLDLTVLDFATDKSLKEVTLHDTLLTLEVLGVDIVVVRHYFDWPRENAGCCLNFSIINASSGVYEHPPKLYSMP